MADIKKDISSAQAKTPTERALERESKKSKGEPDSSKTPTGRASERESLRDRRPVDLTSPTDKGYSDLKDKREPNLKPPLIKDVPTEEEKISATVDFLKTASPQIIAKALGKIEPEALELFFRVAVEEFGAVPAGVDVSKAEPASSSPTPAPRVADAPPLWATRQPGWNDAADEKASPALWIKMHYGNKDCKNWDAMGLTRAALLKFDPALCAAYTTWIGPSRHPDENLHLPTEVRTKPASAEEALRLRRESNLKAYHKRAQRYLLTVHS